MTTSLKQQDLDQVEEEVKEVQYNIKDTEMKEVGGAAAKTTEAGDTIVNSADDKTPLNANNNSSNNSSSNIEKAGLKETPTGAVPGSGSNNGSSNDSSGSSSRNSSKPGGYSADCSSLSHCSDSSSETSNGNGTESPSKRNTLNSRIAPQGQKTTNSHNHSHGHGHGTSSFHSASSSFRPVSGTFSNHNQRSQQKSKQKRDRRKEKEALPQWLGVRLVNPMDPRIDLSSVGVIPASSLYNDADSIIPSEDQQAACTARIRDPEVSEHGREQHQHQQNIEESPNQIKKNTLLNQYTDLMNSLQVSSSIQALAHVNLSQDAAMNMNPSQAGDEIDRGESSINVMAQVKQSFQEESTVLPPPDMDMMQPPGMIETDTHTHSHLPPPGMIQTDTHTHSCTHEHDHAQDKDSRRGGMASSFPIHSNIKCESQSSSNGALSSSASLRSTSVDKNALKVHDLLSSRIVTDRGTDRGTGGSTDRGTGGSTISGGTGGTGSDPARESNSDNIKTVKKLTSSTAAGDKNAEMSTEAAEAATLERLALKKRKRLDKRREYEEEVQRQHQETSDSSRESFKMFKPGDMISMEEALSFAGSARLIVEAVPPYFAVHVNAAFSRLTGIQNSGIIGKPLYKILSIVDGNNWDSLDSLNKEEKTQIADKSFEDSNKEITISIERLMESSDFWSCYKVKTIVDNSNSGNEHSNNSSLTSKEESFTPMMCVMSICAIVTKSTRGRHSCKHKKQDGHKIQDPNPTPQNHHHPTNIESAKKPKRSHIRINSDNIEENSFLRKSHCLIQLTPCENSIGSSLEDKTNMNENSVHGEQEDSCGGGNSSSSHVVACG